jgi:hypothetical protein
MNQPGYFVTDKSGRHCLRDHGGGFDESLRNAYLDLMSKDDSVLTEYILRETPYKLNFIFDIDFKKKLFDGFIDYNCHPELTFEKFLCSFNGSPHVSRKLLVSILHRFGWFDTMTCSKNFSYDSSIIDGHVKDFVANESFYRKFFISNNSDEFFNTINSFGLEQYNHSKNIYNLENKLASSFLHIVSETMATSYYPFVTEKFLYSIVTRGLFLAYAQPGWHDHLERYFGFRRYDKIFDYRFDSIKNPVERLVELMSMIAKFSVLSSDDWRDLYEMEIDTIEYNYDWFFSKKYLKYLEQFC